MSIRAFLLIYIDDESHECDTRLYITNKPEKTEDDLRTETCRETGWDACQVTVVDYTRTIHSLSPQLLAMLEPEKQKMQLALMKIGNWELPPINKFWPNQDGTLSDRPMSYEAAFGSEGAKQYMREVAKEALK